MLGNNYSITGRLGNEPFKRVNKDGSTTVLMTIITERAYKNKKGEKIIDGIPVEAFIPAGKNAKRFDSLHKGSLIQVAAHLIMDNYEVNGSMVYKLKVVLDNIKFLETKSQADARAKRIAESKEETPEETPIEDAPMLSLDDIDDIF